MSDFTQVLEIAPNADAASVELCDTLPASVENCPDLRGIADDLDQGRRKLSLPRQFAAGGMRVDVEIAALLPYEPYQNGPEAPRSGTFKFPHGLAKNVVR
jgi:hypothetical protein